MRCIRTMEKCTWQGTLYFTSVRFTWLVLFVSLGMVTIMQQINWLSFRIQITSCTPFMTHKEEINTADFDTFCIHFELQQELLFSSPKHCNMQLDKLSLCLIKHHAMKTYEGVNFTPQLLYPGGNSPSTTGQEIWTQRWSGHGGYSCLKLKSSCLALSRVTILTEASQLPDGQYIL
jgi:hypothetical protein